MPGVNARMLAVLHAGVENCKPSPDGRHYVGHTSVTVNGRICQDWTAQYPYIHHFTQDYMFPDGSVADAVNYCRNPDNQPGPWCFTTDTSVRWELCDVPLCGQLRYVTFVTVLKILPFVVMQRVARFCQRQLSYSFV